MMSKHAQTPVNIAHNSCITIKKATHIRMKNKLLATLILPVCLAACQPQPAGKGDSANQASPGESAQESDSATAVKKCYAYYNRDTVELSIVTAGKQISGTLRYQLFEKDKNNGTITGEIMGDTLLANYTFNAEGRESERQVAFLRKGEQLIEGYTDVEEKNGKVVFKDASKLKFDETIRLSETPCRN